MVQAIFYAMVINNTAKLRLLKQGDRKKPDVGLTRAEVGHCRGVGAVYWGKAKGRASLLK